MLLESRREAIIELATEGDRLGYDGFFMPEAWAYDMTVLLAEAGGAHDADHAWNRPSSASGTAAPRPSRWPRRHCTRSRADASCSASAPGTPQLAEGLHDTPFEPPVRRMRRMVTQIRALLRGERIPLAVTTNARALKLNVPPTPALPIHIAALGDAMTRLTGELADAWAPFSTRGHGSEPASNDSARARRGVAIRIASRRFTPSCRRWWPIPTRRRVRGGVVRIVLCHGRVRLPDSLIRQGYGKAVEAVLMANAPKFTGVVPNRRRRILEQLIVYGPPPEARRRLGRWHEPAPTSSAASPPEPHAGRARAGARGLRPMLQPA